MCVRVILVSSGSRICLSKFKEQLRAVGGKLVILSIVKLSKDSASLLDSIGIFIAMCRVTIYLTTFSFIQKLPQMKSFFSYISYQ